MAKIPKITAKTREELFSESDGTCAICGQGFESSVLELSHILPLAAEGTSDKDGLMLLCPNCHRGLHRVPREIEFIRFLREVMEGHPGISEVKSEVILGRDARLRADLTAKRRQHGHEELLLIECKTPQALASVPITTTLDQLITYRNLLGHGRMILAVPATLPVQDTTALTSAGEWKYGIYRISYKHFPGRREMKEVAGQSPATHLAQLKPEAQHSRQDTD